MNGGMETLKLIYLAVGPGIALAVYIYYSDRQEPAKSGHSAKESLAESIF